MKKGLGYKKKLKFSVLKLDPEDKAKIEAKASELGISMTQLITFGALRGTQMDIPKKHQLNSSIQIRLPEPLHKELEEKSMKTGRHMTEIISLGIELAFDIKLKKSE